MKSGILAAEAAFAALTDGKSSPTAGNNVHLVNMIYVQHSLLSRNFGVTCTQLRCRIYKKLFKLKSTDNKMSRSEKSY